MIMRNKTPLPLDSGDLPCRKNNNPVSIKSQKFNEESGKKMISTAFFSRRKRKGAARVFRQP